MANNTIKVSKNNKTNSVNYKDNLLKKIDSSNDEYLKSRERARQNISKAKNDYEQIKNVNKLPTVEQNRRKTASNSSLVSYDEMDNLSKLRKQRNQSFGDQALYDYDSVNNEYTNAYKKIASKHNFTDDEMTRMMDRHDALVADREGKTYGKKAEKFAEEHPVLGTIRSFGDNAVSSVLGVPQLLTDTVNGARGKDVSTYGGSHAFGYAKDKTREKVSDKIDSTAGKMAYGIGSSAGDMAVDALISAATGGMASTPMLMAGSTGESAERNARERGVNATQAGLYGIGSGAIDYALNKVGLDKILKQSAGGTAKEIISNMGKGAISEGTANAAQEALQFGFDRLLNGENSDYQIAYNSVYDSSYQKAYEENIAKGMDITKAERRAKQTAEREADKYATSIRNQRIGEGLASGALFGAGMSGARGIGKNVSDTIKANRQAKIDAPNIEYANALMQMIEGKTDESNRAFSDTATPEDMLLLQQLGYNIPNSELPQYVSDADTIRSMIEDNTDSPIEFNRNYNNPEDLKLLEDFGYVDNDGATLPQLNDPRKAFDTNIKRNDARSINRMLDAEGESIKSQIDSNNQRIKELQAEQDSLENLAESESAKQRFAEIDDEIFELEDINSRLSRVIEGENPRTYTSLPMLDSETQKAIDDYRRINETYDRLVKENDLMPKHQIPGLDTSKKKSSRKKPKKSQIVGESTRSKIKSDASSDSSTGERVPSLKNDSVTENPKTVTPDGDKISEMTKKTIPSQVTEEEYNSRYGGDSSFKYESVDEKTSMRNASDYLNSRTVDQAESELLDTNRKFSSQDVDALMQLNQKFIEEARNAQDKAVQDATWNRSFELMKRLRAEGTNDAQVLQALKKWSRNTPEGMMAWAMAKSANANKVATTKAIKQVDKVFRESKTIDEAISKLLKMDLQLFAKGTGSNELLDYIEKNYRGINKDGSISKTKYKDVTSEEMAKLGKKAADIIQKNGDESNLDSAQAKQMYDLFEDANNYPKDSREWNTRMASAMKILDESMPSAVSKKVKTVIYDNMLASMRTMVTRNLGGNLVYNALELVSKPAKVLSDVVASGVTKNRTQKLSGKAIAEGTKGFKGAVKDMALDFKEGTKTTRSGFKSLDDIYSSVERTFKTQSKNKGVQAVHKVLGAYDKIIRTGLELGDRPIYEAAYNANKAELKEIVSQYGEDGLRSGIDDSSIKNIDDLIESMSINAGLEAVMQNNSGMKQAMMKLKQSLGDISKEATGGVDVLSTSTTPFVEVPGNMISRYLQYTPFGFVGNVGRSIGEAKKYGSVNQRRMTTELGRNLTGTALSVLGTSLGAKGMISDAYSDDPEERKAQQNNGYLEYALTNPINGRQYDISDIPVIGAKMVEGKILSDAYQDALDKGEDERTAWLKALYPSLQGGFGDTLFQGLNRLTGADTQYGSGGLIDNIGSNLQSFASSALVPSIVRQTAQYTDDYKRDLGDYATSEYYLNSFKNAIPGEAFGFGRQSLNPKINTAGEEVMEDQGRTGLQRFWDTYLAPYKSSDYQDVMPLLNQEATELKELTNGEYNPQLPLLKQNDLKNTKGYDADMYTHQDLYDYQSEFYSRNSKAGSELLKSNFYNGLTPEEKSEVLSDLYEASKAATKENIARDGKSEKAIADGLSKDELYVSKNKVTPYLKNNDYNGAIKQLEKQYYFKKYNVSNSKEAEEEYAKGVQNFINWATTRSKNKQSAEDYGYYKADGTVNLKGYEKANEFFNGDTRYVQSYAKSNDNMENATSKRLSDGLKYAIPYLYTDRAMSDEEKGMYVTLANKGSVDKLPKAAKKAYDDGGYAGVYQYYLNSTLFALDKNKDGVISQSEFEKKYNPEETSEEFSKYLSGFYGMSY